MFEDIESFESFNPITTKSNYSLLKITNEKVIQKIKKIFDVLENSEKSDHITMLFRGVSKDDWFREYGLFQHFVVGEKGKYYTKQNSSYIYTESFNDIEKMTDEIKDLVEKINKIIMKREKKGHPISGEINIDNLLEISRKSIEDLRYFKIFLSAVLHNVGNQWIDKDNSPFISATYGEKKYEVSKIFASKKSEDETSMVFVYYMLNGSKYYLLTQKLNEILRELNVDWYDDIHSEMIILDGLLPHYNIGILEINDDDYNHNFIVNPWLYYQLLNDIPLDLDNGIKVDQSDFAKLAVNLGYNNYYQQFKNGARSYHRIHGKSYGRSQGFFKK